MPFYVSMQYQGWPGRQDALLAAIQHGLAGSLATRPGLKFARVSQHLTQPDRFLAVEEWQSQADYQRLRESATYREAFAAHGPPPRASVLERLQMYRHLPHRPAALACINLATAPDRAAAVEAFVCDEARRDALVTAGLVLRAVYRVVDHPGQLLVLHGWRSMTHLARFLETTAHDLVAVLEAHGATIDPFAGRVVAEFSWLED